MPLPDVKKNPEQLRLLEDWMRAQKPEELFDARRQADAGVEGAGAHRATRRMSANPHANGGLLKRALRLPDFRNYGVASRQARHDRGRKHPPAGRFPARRDED